MKITYITQTRFPIQKAHGNQIAQVCCAMADLGHEVTLICPSVSNAITQDPFAYYGIQKSFDLQYLPHFDATRHFWIPGFLYFAINMFFYRKALNLFLQTDTSDMYYCRSAQVLDPLLAHNKKVILELHTLPQSQRKHFVSQCNQCEKVVCLTSPMRDELIVWGVKEKKMVVEGDGVDLKRFEDVHTTKQDWNLPKDRWIIGYCGSFVTHGNLEKGVGELLQALSILKRGEAKCFGWIIGGPDTWKEKYISQAQKLGLTEEDVRFEGRISAEDVPSSMSAFDISVYPAPRNAGTHAYFTRDTSPLKLFEYLATGKPIVCADIPPVRDTVSEDNVALYDYKNAQSLADVLHATLNQYDSSVEKAKKGQELVRNFSWQERMERILRENL